jgi:UDP-N-acetylglucosamine 2-epimerase (non-hydrolysing)
MKIAIILGTRPEIIKLSSVIRESQSKGLDFFIIHTNQHYSKEMDEIFFKDLELSKPKYNLNVGSGPHGSQTGNMLIKIEKVLEKEKPDIVLVQGDTNTVLAGALAASKLQIKVGHIEAGLRSYDKTMPEETNRIITDNISDFLFAPNDLQKEILLSEKIDKEKIFVTGNTIVDAVNQNLEMAKKKYKILKKLNLKPKKYILLTLHRPSNVDNKETFEKILTALDKVSKELNLPIIFPIHPRTQNQIKLFGLKLPKKVLAIKPIGFLEFLDLENNSALCLTDSGGIQEESCILKVPCVTLRENTERPETVQVGANIIAGTDPEKILKSVKKMLAKKPAWKNPFGDGNAGKKIIDILIKESALKVSVLGLGYMGLPTACLLANAGYKVTGIDINSEKIKNLQDKKFETTEPGLKELFLSAVKTGRISFSTEIKPADIFLIAVPTPAKNNKIEIKYVESAAKMVASVLKNNNLVILESTVSPNTCKKFLTSILNNQGVKYFLAHCPERAIPGNTLYEVVNNDRIIGGIDKESEKMTKEIYSKFVKGNIFTTEITTAETVKLLENSFRDINIAFANEIAKISKSIGINPWEAISLANKHPRVNILNPGPGVGGHCIPVDPWFLVQDNPEAKFIRLAREINDSMPDYIVEKIKQEFIKRKIKNPKIAVLGVAYKADVDDSRETPATKIIEKMKDLKWKVMIADPFVKNYKYPIDTIENSLENADATILITDHSAFKSYNFKKYPLKFIYDTRNIINKENINSNTELLTFGSNGE